MLTNKCMHYILWVQVQSYVFNIFLDRGKKDGALI